MRVINLLVEWIQLVLVAGPQINFSYKLSRVHACDAMNESLVNYSLSLKFVSGSDLGV